ncbi:hypothetical protein LTR86_003143 [Recurvomyces mirabilis]|nr:hypothetical protein LTR86_003143 [Recurvomyces mirabilis]
MEDGHGYIDPAALTQAEEGPVFSSIPLDIPDALTLGALVPEGNCPSHPGDLCLCHGFLGDWGVAAPLPAVTETFTTPGLDEPDYSKFENWIPRFVRPEKPCDYCKSKRLDCYLQRGQASCTPCKSLFRECSLTNSQTLESVNYFDKDRGTFLDTLHAVDEDQCCQGGLTGIKTLRSKGHSGTVTPPVFEDDAPGSSKRNGMRFPRNAVKILREWLDTHVDHPYPSEAEKIELERKTELKPAQIANWLANARRRRKVADKARPRVCASPSLRPTTPALPIPGAAEKPWEELNPLQRWQHSPPENEPAAFTDIANAVANSDLPDDGSTSPSSAGRPKKSSAGSGFSNFRAPSTTSLDTSGAQSSSISQSSAAFSQGSSQSLGSFGSFNSSLAGKRDRRRRRRPTALAQQRQSEDKKRMFQCTFCTDTFKSKYDWTRHEKSLHLSLEKWICHPLGPMLVDPVTNEKKCVYCEERDPSSEHIEGHNHRQCEDKGLDARTFYRKDHLRQHLRLMHGCGMTAPMDIWKSTAVNINSRCGFCAQRFTVWQERVDHLTAHFKAGVRMREWKGCRGLDPAVAAQVTNAMPPYLIGIEAVSPQPFSATNRSSWHLRRPSQGGQQVYDAYSNDPLMRPTVAEVDNNYSTKATCWEILTVRLGKYANEMAQKGIVLTDEMLQQQARRILYESDDSWNQTAADNPEWLDLFKKAHGLDFIPDAVGGLGLDIPEDLETYGDLGLRIPFAVQLAAYNSKQAVGQSSSKFVPEAYHEALANRRTHFRDLYAQLYEAGKLHDEGFRCGHEECKDNVADISWLDASDISGSKHKRWCSQEVPSELVKPFAVYGYRSPSSTAPHTVQNSVSAGHSMGAIPTHLNTDWLIDNAEQSSRVKGLEALARMEVPMVDCPIPPSERIGGRIPRHRMELPPDRAQRFATVTGPWEDAGMMPDAIPGYTAPGVLSADLSLPTIEQANQVSTGAMMEFLGGEMGGHLPFSTDANTSTIPLMVSASELGQIDWSMQDLDELVAATSTAPPATATQLATAWHGGSSIFAAQSLVHSNSRSSLPTMIAEESLGADLVMEDLNFDDMTFDAAYDLPLDDTFLPQME